MLILKKSLNAWGSSEFNKALKSEIELLDINHLPLQQGLSHSSVALDDELEAVILEKSATADKIFVIAGIFYFGIIAGCNCSDDPSPVDRLNEYCEVRITIDKHTGVADIQLIKT